MDYIEWNYTQAKKQAAKLDEQAVRLNQMASAQMEDMLRDLSFNWKGSSACAYTRKGENLKNEILCLSRELKKTAAVIRSSAERIYQAEMKARELAQRRVY